jgi:hypothetical protein
MFIDIVEKNRAKLAVQLKELGFEVIFELKGDTLIDPEDKNSFELRTYYGKDYDFVIRKGKADVILNLENNGFLLNKGLCSKLKENHMFVVFKFTSLLESQEVFKTYKNMLINGRLCADYGVDTLYVSSARDLDDIKAPAQLVAFAEQFGYHYLNYKRAIENLLKRK